MSVPRKLILYIVFALGLHGGITTGPILNAQDYPVRISEFLAANTSVGPDNHDFEDYSDWVELENTSESEVYLGNLFLSDDPANPMKWTFDADAVMPPMSLLLIRADGHDAVPGETHGRGYWPWEDFTTLYYHTNFRLNADGESLILSVSESSHQNISFLPEGSVWKYFDLGEQPGSDWYSPYFDDSTWASGPAELGYGDGDETTTVSYGPNTGNKYPTTYFRSEFTVANAAQIVRLTCRALIDDGAVIYFNGVEVARVRMGNNGTAYGSYAEDSATEGVYDQISLPRDLLLTGSNVLAVAVHQVSASSSDLSFDMEITGTEVTGPVEIVDSIDYGYQLDDVSMGRRYADSDTWYYFGEPTPGRPNWVEGTFNRVPAGSVYCDPAGGFFSSSQTVTLTTDEPDGTIHYSLDGSVPDSSSPVFSEPLLIEATTVLRARVLATGKLPGKLETQTYFIGEPDRDLPVVGMTVSPDSFFDTTVGIYTNGFKGKEVPNTIEFYEGTGQLAFKVNAGTRIGGENIWRFAQKPLNIALRNRYGDDLISYPVFPGKSMAGFDALGFRNGGDNWPNAMLRDVIAPGLVEGQMNNDVAWYRPVVLYLNGNYRGIHNLRLRFDDAYFSDGYQIPSGKYDIVQKGNTIDGTVLLADHGELEAYLLFEAFVTQQDLSDPDSYSAVQALMDVENLMDYCAMIDFVYESSWHHNQEFWREQREGAVWRWNINDIDRGFNINNVSSSLIDNMLASHPVFQSLARNQSFRNYFAQRYAAHMGSTFHPDRIAGIVDTLAEEVEGEVPRHIERWQSEGGMASLASRAAEINEIKQFATERSAHVFSDMANFLGLDNVTARLEITLDPPAAGYVLINGVRVLPDINDSITLYRDITFELEAMPAPGYVFSHWSSGEADSGISGNLNGDTALTATFIRSRETLVASEIEGSVILTVQGSPYVATDDITVLTGGTLIIEAGVNLRMPEAASISVFGQMQVSGSEQAPVVIESRNESEQWGGLAFIDTSGPSLLNYLIISGATHPRQDPVNLKGAISGLNAELVIDNSEIVAAFPIFTRGGSTTIRRSFIHPTFTGDGINIKSGSGLVEDCTFLGNEAEDTDAIDFDNVTGGRISGNRIYAFRGSNSDAIDIGEGCSDLLVSGNRIYNCTDKGVSVGQASTVSISRNLIVGCDMGVAVKDLNSTAYIDQNTFVDNRLGVAAYEKNYGAGGGEATVENCIFSNSGEADIFWDELSLVDVSYSLSDTRVLPDGTGNLMDDPMFTDPGIYDFSVSGESSVIDSGNPGHAQDEDSSRADIGCLYQYDIEDYPFRVPNVIVINEVMAHSNTATGDWIELYNNSREPIDISGWYLSDDADEPLKYRIADNSVIGGESYFVFTEADNFGLSSGDAGSLQPFALSENGELVYLFGPNDGFWLDYRESETFGASAPDISLGRYYKKSTDSYNFVAMAAATPGIANSYPLVGPVVISEIMYHPVNGDAEYIELCNISNTPVVLFDSETGEPWKMTEGIDFNFPRTPETILFLNAGERCLLVRDETIFLGEYTVPVDVKILQWTGGGLNNAGEKLEIAMPGDIDNQGARQYIRIDRVNYGDSDLWPVEADGGGYSLTRLLNHDYGNDVDNWTACTPTPGTSVYTHWAAQMGLLSETRDPLNDPDEDGWPNIFEYLLAFDPLSANDYFPWKANYESTGGELFWIVQVSPPEMEYSVERTDDLSAGNWFPIEIELDAASEVIIIRADMEADSQSVNQAFYRLVIRLY